MELSQLKYFSTAAKYEHITRAAEELHIAQPALTQSIHKLEEELGVKLFERNGRQIALTSYGRYFWERIRPLLATIDSVKDELYQMSMKSSKTIRIGVELGAATVANAVVEYQALHSDVLFNMKRPDLDENCDIAVLCANSDFRRFINEGCECSYFSDKIMLAVSSASDYAKLSSIDLQDLKNANFVAVSTHHNFRNRFDQICTSVGFKPHISFECDDPVMAMHLVGHGLGVAFYSPYCWSPTKHSDICLIPINLPKECTLDIVIINRKAVDNHSLINDFYRFLINYYNNAKLL